MTWARRIEVGVAGGLAVALGVCAWIIWHEPKPKRLGPNVFCSYIGPAERGVVTITPGGDLAFASEGVGTSESGRLFVDASDVGTVGRALEQINSSSEWRCFEEPR